MSILTERDRIITATADADTGEVNVTIVDEKQEVIVPQSDESSEVGKQDEVTMAAVSKKNDNILMATMISTGAYALLNLILFAFYFVWPGAFRWALFKGWGHLFEHAAFFHAFNNIWFVFVILSAILVFIGIHTKRPHLLLPQLVLASAEFVQIALYFATFFSFALVGGLFGEKNYFGMESDVAYVFSILGVGLLMIAFAVSYFCAFVGLVFEAKKILESKVFGRKRIPSA
jgi:hypothetical protein